MVHRHSDVFEISPEPKGWFENKTVQFVTGVEGHVESLAVPLEPAVAPIVFRRLPEPEMAARAFLEPLAAIYRYGTIVFRIGIDEAGRLTFTRNGAATERLQHLRLCRQRVLPHRVPPQPCGRGGRSNVP